MCRQGKFHPPNLEKTVDNSPHIGYNIPCQQPADIQKVKILGICIVVVRQTLTLFVGVRFSHPQPNPTAAQSAAVFSGHSAAGSAPGSGLGGRGFKSRCSDQSKNLCENSQFECSCGFFFFCRCCTDARKRTKTLFSALKKSAKSRRFQQKKPLCHTGQVEHRGVRRFGCSVLR